MGILKIIPKLDTKTKLHIRIENAATAILSSRKKRFHSIKLKIEGLGIESESLTFNNKTFQIKTWLKKIFEGNYTIEEENKIKNSIALMCNQYMVPEGGNPHTFPQIGG